jgi:hypothetical protein
MALKSDYTLFAESVIRDETGKISLINIFDRLQAEKLPVIQGKFVIIFGVLDKSRDGVDKGVNLYGYTPDKKLFVKSPLPVALTPKVDHGQIVADLSGMPIEHYGNYNFALGYDEKSIIASKILTVDKLPIKKG